MSANNESHEKYVLDKYTDAIKYYWDASRSNKRWYKQTRRWLVILGALVTLVSSLSSAKFIDAHAVPKTIFAIAVPTIAAILTVISGLSQAFHWGAAWRDMVLNAQRLQRERDRFVVTKPADRDFKKELAILHNLVIAETQSFFQRILGGAKKDRLPKPGHTEKWIDPPQNSGSGTGEPGQD